MNIPHDVLSVITPVFLSFLTAVIWVGIKWAQSKAAWFEMRTKEWERIANEAREHAAKASETAQEALKTSSSNHVLLERNTKLTEQAARNSDGVNARLQSIAAASAFTLGKIKAKVEESGTIDTSEIEELENQFKDVMGSEEFDKVNK